MCAPRVMCHPSIGPMLQPLRHCACLYSQALEGLYTHSPSALFKLKRGKYITKYQHNDRRKKQSMCTMLRYVDLGHVPMRFYVMSL